MMSFQTEYPRPLPVPTVSVPPLPLLAAWIPELEAEAVAVIEAHRASEEARDRFEEVLPGAVTSAGPGAHGAVWEAAMEADMAAVVAGKPTTAIGKTISLQAPRYGEWLARVGVERRLSEVWNVSARSRVNRKSITGLQAEERRLRAAVLDQAKQARVDAETGGLSDQSRVRAARASLSRMELAAQEWRPVYQLAVWVMEGPAWGQAWSDGPADMYPTTDDPMNDPVQWALAVTDPTLAGQLETGMKARARR